MYVFLCRMEPYNSLSLSFSRTLFDVQNVWGRTAVDTQKPIDTSPLTEMPRQDVCAFVLYLGLVSMDLFF